MNIKSLILAVLGVGTCSSMAAQSMEYKFWVEFTDKNNSVYSVSKPEQFLSQRAIDRRKKQSIPITEVDFPVNQVYINTVATFKVTILNPSRWFNAVSIAVKDDTSALEEIRKLPFVKGTKLMYAKLENPNQPNTSAMTELMISMGANQVPDNTTEYGLAFTQINQLKGEELHQMGFRGENMVIAILDAGFYKTNQMATFMPLFNEGRILGTYDFVKLDTSVFEDDMHGMNVLSCIAANTPGKMVGTAPKASFWLLRTEDAHTEYPIEEANWVSGAEFADSVGADLINSSLGYTKYDAPLKGYSYQNLDGSSLISRAAKMAAAKGIIVCNAAGNEGSDKWKYVGVPADADNIVTVGGIDGFGNHASFSSYGPTADGRIKPTISARAAETVVASSKNKFYESNGTSFASPVMCGAIACLWQANPTKSALEVIDALKKSGHQAFNPDNVLGYGVPNMVLASRILGKDPGFDYNKNQLLQIAPIIPSSSIGFLFYSAKAQKIKINIIDAKNGKTLLSQEKEAQKGEFVLSQTGEFKIPKGDFEVILIADGEEFKTQFSKKEITKTEKGKRKKK